MTTSYEIRHDDTASQLVDGELLVINFESSFFYGLNRSAAAVWTLLESPQTASSVVEALSAALGLGGDELSPDVDRLLTEMVTEGLIAETDAPGGTTATELEVSGGWEPPEIERYERLDQLILSGE